jgi:hypothetical protein
MCNRKEIEKLLLVIHLNIHNGEKCAKAASVLFFGDNDLNSFLRRKKLG